MPFDDLVQLAPVKKRNVKLGPRGCDACTLNKVHGIRKIMGSIEGREILIIAQSPGPEENEAQRELVGKSGQFLWAELKRVGIRRSDCDVQNAIRCFPADLTEGTYNSFLKMRNPSPLEIHCCSVHTETAMAQSKAKHILILGQVAAKAFLATKSVPQQKIFWSERHRAKIYLCDHPAFFIRGYGAGARLQSFRSTLEQLAAGWKNVDAQPGDDFDFLRAQRYYLIKTAAAAVKAGRRIKAYAKKGIRSSVDIEYDIIDGKKVVFAVGFSPKIGLAYIFVFDNPLIYQKPEDCRTVKGWVRALLQHPDVREVMHYGCSDETMLRANRIDVQGYDWDTYFGEYLCFPEQKSFGLDDIAERRFQEFSGYKTIVVKDLMEALPPEIKVPSAVASGPPSAQLKWIKKIGEYHLTRLKPDTLRLYNGGDADLTKRCEVDTKKKVKPALMRLYIDLSFVLKEMEANGPWFDSWQYAQAKRLWPYLAAKALQKLRDMIDDQEFNPGSPQQVYDVIYNRLGLIYPLRKGKANTQKKTMMMLSREHPFPGAVVEWRRLDKAESTYIDGGAAVAKRFGGRAKTKWSATGTETGRLSSSGGDEGGLNLQNLHKDPRLQNMYVSDKRWRKVFNAISGVIRTQPRAMWEQLIEQWVRDNMPDLKVFLMLDYGQIEVRVMAQVSGDENLLSDCKSADIHTTVGVAMTGWAADKIKNDNKTRTLTKNCVAEGQLVLTDVGLVPIEKVERWMLVWDGLEFVSHEGVVCQGERSVISYKGLTATPDHKVWLASGRKVSFEYAAARKMDIAVTGIEEHPLRYSTDHITQNKYRREVPVCLRQMLGVPEGFYGIRRFDPPQNEHGLCVPTRTEVCDAAGTYTCRQVLCDSAAVRQSAKRQLASLRRSGHSEQVFRGRRVRALCNLQTAACDVPFSGDRPHQQRRSLRTGKFATCDETAQQLEYAQDETYIISRGSPTRSGSSAQIKGSWDGVESDTGRASAGQRNSLAERGSSDSTRSVSKVYDIVNAGPRHRFTVQGFLVSNCHFGIMFGIDKGNLFDFIKAMDPTFEGTEEMVFEAYDRYFERYKGVKRYIEAQRESAETNGFVETLFGLHRTLNITGYRGAFDEDEEYIDESGERKSSWRNQAINTPVQGTAHQLLCCGLVNVRRQPEKYKVLGVPSMDVHDALYLIVNVLELREAYRKARYLLEHESLETVKKDFPDIDWRVPIMVEAEAGIRLGGRVSLEDDKFTIGGFLLDWYNVTKKQIIELRKQLKDVPEAVDAA